MRGKLLVQSKEMWREGTGWYAAWVRSPHRNLYCGPDRRTAEDLYLRALAAGLDAHCSLTDDVPGDLADGDEGDL